MAAVATLAFGGCETDCRDYCACDCFSGCSSDGEEIIWVGLRNYTDDNGCPCCTCYVRNTYVCAEGCVESGERVAVCAEDVSDTCGNGVLDTYEPCDPGLAVEPCTDPFCPVPGVWQDCYRDCSPRYGRICELPREICGNGIDEDCDGSTDEGCG